MKQRTTSNADSSSMFRSKKKRKRKVKGSASVTLKDSAFAKDASEKMDANEEEADYQA